MILRITTSIITILLIALNARMTYISGDMHPAIRYIWRKACPLYSLDNKWKFAWDFFVSWATFYITLSLCFVPILNVFLAVCALLMNHSMIHLKHPVRLLKICFRKKAYK